MNKNNHRAVIAILSPNQNAYSETFIQAHRHLNGEIKFYYGGFLPAYLEGYGKLIPDSFSKRVRDKVKRGFFKNSFTPVKAALMKSLKANKVNVVLAEYGPTGAEVWEMCKKIGLPLIIHFHGFDASHKETLDHYAPSYQEAFKYATSIIGVSNEMMRALLELGVPGDKLVYNPYGPDESFFSIQSKVNANKFFSVGRFVEKKGPHLTLFAFKKVLDAHPDACLYMGGDGPLLPVCKDLARVLKIQERVFYLGKIVPEQVKANMTDSLAFVQHSLTAADGDMEGTPVAVLEAGAAGLPVVSTRHAGIPDVVIDGETGFLVEERDVDGMAFNMIKLANDFNLAKEMGCKARNRIKENFSLERHLSKLNELIEKVQSV